MTLVSECDLQFLIGVHPVIVFIIINLMNRASSNLSESSGSASKSAFTPLPSSVNTPRKKSQQILKDDSELSELPL